VVTPGRASRHRARRDRTVTGGPVRKPGSTERAGLLPWFAGRPPGQRINRSFRVPERSGEAVIYQPLILAICAVDKVTMEDGSGWKFTCASCAVPLVIAQVRNARRSCARAALACEVRTTAYS
jgi:hypothetical protein